MSRAGKPTAGGKMGMSERNKTLPHSESVRALSVRIFDKVGCKPIYQLGSFVNLISTFQHQIETTRQTAHHGLVGYTLTNECE